MRAIQFGDDNDPLTESRSARTSKPQSFDKLRAGSVAESATRMGRPPSVYTFLVF